MPLLLPEPRSTQLTELLATGPPVVWWASPVECWSAIHRRHRQATIPSRLLDTALARHRALFASADTVPASEEVLELAGRLLATHSLRAADALQLAAALVWCEGAPLEEGFVCLDDRLQASASTEGFRIIP